MGNKRILIVLLILLFFSAPCYAATIVRYVNPAATDGGDGTTTATDAGDAHRAYHSLADWEGHENQDLDTGNNIAQVNCAGSTVDDHTCTIDGWTTSATDYIEIISEANPTPGIYNVNSYHRTAVVNVAEGNIYIRNVYCKVISTNWAVTGAGVVGFVEFDSCYSHITATAGNNYDIYSVGTMELRMYNCIAINDRAATNGRGFYINDDDITAYLYNCTGYTDDGPAFQMTAYTACTIKNCIGYSSDGASFGEADADKTPLVTYCASDDDTADNWTGTGSIINVTFHFVDTVSADRDLHLAAGDDSGCVDGGTNDPGTGLFSDDIDGVTRSGTWDIGADEYVSAGAARRIIFIQ